MQTRVVIPLRSMQAMEHRASTLNPVLNVAGKQAVLDTASLAPVPSGMLRKPIARADASAAAILDALDALFGGY